MNLLQFCRETITWHCYATISVNILLKPTKEIKPNNLRARPISFALGQEVYRRNFAQSSAEKAFNAKLSPLFLKSIVKEKVGQNYYILTDMDGRTVGTYHAKDIRP